MRQPQLLKMALDPADVVYTPDWVARDMVEFFAPTGMILEPCSGDGVFLRYLPADTLWCEIERGRDFFKWDTAVDWCFGNPPYSIKADWIYHTMDIAAQFVYLLPCNTPFNSSKILRVLETWGGIRHMRHYGPGGKLGFPFGYACGAIHFVRDYRGPMHYSNAAPAIPLTDPQKRL